MACIWWTSTLATFRLAIEGDDSRLLNERSAWIRIAFLVAGDRVLAACCEQVGGDFIAEESWFENFGKRSKAQDPRLELGGRVEFKFEDDVIC